MIVTVDPWVRSYPARGRTARRFLCFPPAGSGAGFYRDWPAELPDDAELWTVQYPGREDRFGEPAVTDLKQLADAVTRVPGLASGPPLWLFGHSMGALVAYEVARRLEESAPGAVARLVVSGRPGLGYQRDLANGPRHRRDDAAFVAELRALGGIPEEVLAEPEMLEILLSIMRADYQAFETYDPGRPAPLTVPVLALAGDSDRDTSVEQMRAWADVTTGRFRLIVHPGGHFFLVSRLTAVMADVLGAV